VCSSMKAALTCLDRGEDPADYIKSFVAKPKTYFDSHVDELPGFISSAKGMLDEARQCLLALEKSSDDKARIESAFRIFHTLKGEANITGLLWIGKLANEAEDLLSALRAGTIKMDSELIAVLLKTVDQLRKLFDELSIDPSKASQEDVAVSQPPLLDLSNGPDIYMDFIAEASDHLTNSEKSVLILETNLDNSEAINNIFRAFHTIKGAAGFMDLEDIKRYAHETETMLDLVRKGSLSFKGSVVDLTLLSIDGIRKLLELLQEQLRNNGQVKGKYLDIGPKIDALRDVCRLKKNQPIGEILIKQGVITNGELQEALNIQKEVLGTLKSGASVMPTIRIHLDKLDGLVDMVGELVISETLLVQNPQIVAIKEQHFKRNIDEFDRITRNLQQMVMSMRLVPIGPVFHKMERLVRDLSKTVGKDVVVILNGEETEIDKNMAELVADPLMHMVRNSMDHGIESREERLAKGKPPIGRVELSASHKGGFVVIEVKDDGNGLDREKILKKAIERGIVNSDENLSNNRIFNLIFEAGFTTSEKVTDTSGRGVGMDVVRKNIDKLHGKINISSFEGQGTVFSLYIPITLAIVDGIVIRAGDERYVLPINSVIEFIQPKEADRTWVYGKEQMYKVYDKVYPLVHLKDVFGVSGGKQNFEEQTICILDSDFGKACVVVDELLGQQQVVIKNLGKKLTNIPGISGAAILGDGRVGLILDASSLIEFSVKQAVY